MRNQPGSRPFTLDAPYEVLLPEVLEPGQRYPLVTALHGMGQDAATMRRALEPLTSRPWIWLLPRGPYPMEVRGRESLRVGYAWYMYDGDQDRLRQSMDATCRHLLGVLDDVWNRYPVDLGRSALAGYSQGGYLAGVLGPRNPARFCAVACISGRFKHEFLHDVAAGAGKRVALAQFHGARDESVKALAAREALETCRRIGFERAEYFEDASAGHEISPAMVQELGGWLDRLLKS